MAPDHYATLGLSPTSEDVVIRAAYRALIRRYHPDGNASTAAASRARAINAAYAVLIDPEKRAEYDRLRAAVAWPNAPLRRSVAPVRSRLFAAVSVMLLLVLVSLVVWSPLPLAKPPVHVAQVPDRKRDINRDVPVLPPAEDSAAIIDAVDAEVANPQLDEPLPAPLPDLTGTVAASPPPSTPSRPSRPSRAPATLSKPAARPVAARPDVAEANPSFSCAAARTRGEFAVCGDANLAGLDQQQALLYSQSWLGADPTKRKLLQTTRNRFLVRRDGCRSIACTRAVYLARMREVSQIMIEQPKPNRMAP